MIIKSPSEGIRLLSMIFKGQATGQESTASPESLLYDRSRLPSDLQDSYLHSSKQVTVGLIRLRGNGLSNRYSTDSMHDNKLEVLKARLLRLIPRVSDLANLEQSPCVSFKMTPKIILMLLRQRLVLRNHQFMQYKCCYIPFSFHIL